MKIDGRNLLNSIRQTNNKSGKQNTNPTLYERLNNKKSFTEKKKEIVEKTQNSVSNNIFEGSKQYREELRISRQNATATQNKLKKLKYQFKSLSSKIIRSKTSASAKQVAGQARREVIRLNNERQSGNDSEELQAAIAHAKSMERVAKKKAKHLEEEEMAKAAGGVCGDFQMTDEEFEEELEKSMRENNALYDAEYSFNKLSDSETEFEEEIDFEQIERMMENLSKLQDISAKSEEEFLEEMASLSDMEFMEELGLDELADELMAAKKDMDPADFKMMRIKHRNKEMKDIVKADAEYLKALFHHLGETAANGQAVASGGSGISIENAQEVSVTGGAMPIIDYEV